MLRTKSLDLSCYGCQDKIAPAANQLQIHFVIVLCTSSSAALHCPESSPALGLVSVKGEEGGEIKYLCVFPSFACDAS